MQTQTITVPMESGEAAVFTLGFETTVEEFMDNLDWVVSPQCVVEMEKEGLWKIL